LLPSIAVNKLPQFAATACEAIAEIESFQVAKGLVGLTGDDVAEA
jgi:hypothetical protein